MDNQKELDPKYNGVEVTKTWTFAAFCKEFGKAKFAECVNKSTGETFNALAFENPEDKSITFASFSYSCSDIISANDVRACKDQLTIGLNTNGKYTCFKQNGGWEEI